MAVVEDGTGVIGSTAGGVVEEEAIQDQLFLRSASGLLV